MHGYQHYVTGALNATGQRCPALPHSTTIPAVAPPSLSLFLASVSFSWRCVLWPVVPLAALLGCSWQELPCISQDSIAGASMSPHPTLLGALPDPVPACAWALPRVPACVPGLSRERHCPCQVVLPEEELTLSLLQGQGLPSAASHRRGQEVSGPITMGLCAVSVLLSTDLVQFCTVFSQPGQLRTHGQRARRLPHTRGAPAAALAPARVPGLFCPMAAGWEPVSLGPELG